MSFNIVKLGEICFFSRGLTYSKSDEVEFSSNVVIRANNIDLKTHTLNFNELRYIDDSIVVRDDKKIKKNDILICTASGSKSHLGKVALVEEDLSMAFGGFMGALRADSASISPQYLYRFLISDLFKRHVDGLSDGANINNLKFSQIEKLEIPLPSLVTQKKIVEKIDSIFAEIDRATVATEANAKNAEALFQSYLTKVFERGGEDWVTNKLSTICSKIGSGATPRGGNDSYKSEGISLIRSMNVYDDGFLYDSLAHIDEEQAKALDNVTVENDDVLFNITGASVARCCVVPIDVLPARVNQHVSILRAIKEKINPNLLHLLLVSKFHKNNLLKVGESGGTTRQAITKSQLMDYEISYPQELDSQKELVQSFQEFKSVTNSLKRASLEKLNSFHPMKQSILKKAFSGDLVKE